MTKPTPDQEPELIVDTDWKEQVAKEKELLREDHSDVDDDTKSSESKRVPEELPPPPAASFEVHVTMLFTQAMAMLGQIPDPATGETQINKPYAKHYIDTMEMLGEKTAGNLSDDEGKMLKDAMHALRMAYVNAKSPSH